jgi:hypothetical protein
MTNTPADRGSELAELKQTLEVIKKIGYVVTHRADYKGGEHEDVGLMIGWLEEFAKSLESRVKAMETPPALSVVDASSTVEAK